MTMAMTKAVEKGAQVVICASTGNTSASAAAYAARAKLKCVVILPDGNIAMGKLAQALMYGAQTNALRGNFDEALNIVRELGETGKVEIVNSINPFRIEGQKTAFSRYATNWGELRIFTFTRGQCWKHHSLLERLPGIPPVGSGLIHSRDVRLSGGRFCSHR